MLSTLSSTPSFKCATFSERSVMGHLFTSTFFLCILTNVISSIFLRSCVQNITKTPAVCCPIPKGHTKPCGYPSRGICEPTQAFKDVWNPIYAFQLKTDVRAHWPHRVFQYTCGCRGKFWGQDCGHCWYGFDGENCQRRTIAVRGRASKMTKAQRHHFLSVLDKAEEEPSPYLVPTGIPRNNRLQGPWKSTNVREYLIFLHWFACYLFQSNNDNVWTKAKSASDFGHAQPNFLIFHRMYLLEWEKEMNRISEKYFGVRNWTIPYFDWTDKTDCDVCTDDLIGSETSHFDPPSGGFFLSPKSPVSKWPSYCSAVDRSPCSNCYHTNRTRHVTRRWLNKKFPPSKDVRTALSMPLLYNSSSFCYSFSYFIAQADGCFCDPTVSTLHKRVHVMTNGTLLRTDESPSDPLFLVHHANVDRLLTRWFKRVQPSTHELPAGGACRRCAIPPILPTLKSEDMVVDTERLGFVYEDLDFGPVKWEEKIESAFNKFTTPKDRGCPIHIG